MTFAKRAPLALLFALIGGVLAAPAAAQEDRPNPIMKARIGGKARYTFESVSPQRSILGDFTVVLKDRQQTQYVVQEVSHFPNAGRTEEVKVYPLKSTMLAQIEAVYGAQYKDFKITKSTREPVAHQIGERNYDCERLHVEFDAVWEQKNDQGEVVATSKCKGDLDFDLADGAGPLGMVVFRSIVSFETTPGRFSLSQNLLMRLVAVE